MLIDPESLYLQLGRLVESMPDLTNEPTSDSTLQWLGQAAALVEASGDLVDSASFNSASRNLHSPVLGYSNAQTIRVIVYRALARAELSAPISAKGSFIPAGNAFDALATVGKILGSAKQEVMIVDPYLDEKVLTDFALTMPENTCLKLLTDEKHHKLSLKPAVSRWRTQYNSTRPIDAKIAASGKLHDRVIFVDDSAAWVLTQSLNAFAARSPAAIVKPDAETSSLKLAAYRDLWHASRDLLTDLQ